MPGWTPPPDVPFDHEVAAATRRAVRRVRRRLDELREAEARGAVSARRGWRGSSRQVHDRLLHRHTLALDEVMDELARLEGAIASAQDDARREQRRRRGLHAQWAAEAAAERARGVA